VDSPRDSAVRPTDLWSSLGSACGSDGYCFSALRLFIGHVLPSGTEDVTQIISLVLMLSCFTGGLCIPVSQFPHTYATSAKFMPLYGSTSLCICPLVGNRFEWIWVLNLVLNLAVFAGKRLRFLSTRSAVDDGGL